jgi:creatinine amidohydrolase
MQSMGSRERRIEGGTVMLSITNSRPEFEQGNVKVAILPIGAVEQHGSHLPVGTDTIIASAVAERVAGRLDAYLLPAVAISSSIEHKKALGTVYLKSTTLGLVVRDIAESLHEAGFRKLIIINGHGGNWILKPTIRQLNREMSGQFTGCADGGLETILIHTSAGLDRQHEVMEHKQHDVHAGEKETSIMLHLHPQYVGTIRELPGQQFQPQEYMDYFDVMDLSGDGYWGYPESGTADKGAKLMDIIVEAALQAIERIEWYRTELNKQKGEGDNQ